MIHVHSTNDEINTKEVRSVVLTVYPFDSECLQCVEVDSGLELKKGIVR